MSNIYEELLSRIIIEPVKIQSEVSVGSVRKGIFRAMGKLEADMAGMVSFNKSDLVTEVIKINEDGSSIIVISLVAKEQRVTIKILEGDCNEQAGSS